MLYILESIMNFDFFDVFTNPNVMFFYVHASKAAATVAMWLATKAETCHNDGKYHNRQNEYSVNYHKMHYYYSFTNQAKNYIYNYIHD